MCPIWRNGCNVLALSAGVLLAGCGTNGNSGVRVVNASPGLSGFTVQVGVIGVASSLPYGTEGVEQGGQYTLDTSGKYRPVGAGTKQALIVYAATPSDVLTTSTQTLVKGTNYTLVTLGHAPSIALLTLTDNGTTPTAGGASLRIVQASSLAGPVDVYVTAAGAPLPGTPTAPGLGFTSVTTYLPVPGASDEIRVTPQGNPGQILVDETVPLSGGGLYTAYPLDPQVGGATKFGLLVTGDAGITAK